MATTDLIAPRRRPPSGGEWFERATLDDTDVVPAAPRRRSQPARRLHLDDPGLEMLVAEDVFGGVTVLRAKRRR